MEMSMSEAEGIDTWANKDADIRFYSDSLDRLHRWIGIDYSGWDPYDGLNGKKLHRLASKVNISEVLLVQFHRTFPFNTRPAFGIEKGVDTKGLALFCQSYCNMASLGRHDAGSNAKNVYDLLMSRSMVRDLGYHAWSSHYFPFVGFDRGELSPNVPDTIGTCTAINAALQFTRTFPQLGSVDQKLLVGYFESILRTHEGNSYFAYTPHMTKNVPNASAECLATISNLEEGLEGDLGERVDEVMRSLIALQNDDGHWPYSIGESGHVREQIDFHQAYVIEGLMKYQRIAKQKDRDEIDRSIQAGSAFYRKQFSDDGQCFYRYPTRYPVDIHNQSQGIITFCNLSEHYHDPSHLEFATRIARWTIKQMQDSSGFFYYQRRPLLVNRIPYMRWNQAWMSLALSKLLLTIQRSGS
jgi:hypothetical protein